ncbi:ferredoxin FdxA [Oxalicibacterium solurbis]|uniref:Ferredoxin n=1 Tax=Oxalicibacterium solurbis TaxID=69280 RepID=A0A8J3AWC4_9BURK|nr:ferredoxin FdxA [Oxalicibacterium solurbis]GGI54774.1 ferredoxin [Oxalicibacterium solurbis]
MTHVVGESCIGCKYTDCVAVCPVECFHEGPNFLVIDPEVCIDCGVCVAECPVEAVYDEKMLPAEQGEYVELNARLAKQWPLIVQSTEPLPEADTWAEKQDKREHLMEMS